MKRCPSCNRTYEDEAQNFCLSDGSVLIEDGSASGSLDPAPPVAAPPPATDWSAPPAQAVPSTPAWSMVGNPPHAPSPSWSAGYPQTPPGGGYMVQKKEQGLAIGSLVCGVLSFVCCSIFTGIPAIVLGLMAMNKEKNDPSRYAGKGMAIGGIVMGSLSILIFLLYIVLMMAGAIDMS